MPQVRMRRRIAGALGKRLQEVAFDRVEDPRDPRGIRWDLATLLSGTVVGMAAGATSLQAVESLTESLSPEIRGWLKLPARIPDTTLRDALCQLTPELLRAPLHRVIKAADRRKALEPSGLPFGVASIDGKSFSIPSCDDRYAQRHTQSADAGLCGLVRTVTVALTSTPARPVIDVLPIPAETNEMGHYELVLQALLAAYPSDLFRLVTYDAGACSLHHAAVTRRHGLHYLFALKDSQPTLRDEARRVLADLEPGRADAITEEQVGTDIIIRRVYVAQASAIAPPEGWEHLKTVLRVQYEKVDSSGRSTFEDRYFVSSLPSSRLTSAQWGLVIRRHWGVELAHQTLDVALREDAKPWITANPRGAAVVAVLRRIAYTMLALFRSVTQRSEQRRRMPWAELLRDVYLVMVATPRGDLANIRRRPPAAPS